MGIIKNLMKHFKGNAREIKEDEAVLNNQGNEINTLRNGT